MKRFAIFTHDTFGLGHVRRCLHIVRELCRRDSEAAVLLITGSPYVRIEPSIHVIVPLLSITVSSPTRSFVLPVITFNWPL